MHGFSDGQEEACAVIAAFCEECVVFLILDILLFLWKDPKGQGMAASQIRPPATPPPPGAAAPAAAAPVHHAPPLHWEWAARLR